VEVIEITLAVEKGIAPTENSRAHEVIIERGEIKCWCEDATRFEANQAPQGDRGLRGD
jgi:hypothetical protein